MHSVISLDGTWEFLHVADDGVPGPLQVRSITVPGPWQAQFADLRMKAGTGIYRREVHLPAGWVRDRVFLHFGAVFHNARVWVNGALVGSNEGGFLPFSFDVTEHLREGSNEIKLRVESPTDDPSQFPETPLAEIPFGKQSWYGPLSGIWQSVRLERRPADHIARVRLLPDLRTGRLRAELLLAREPSPSAEVEIRVFDPAGRLAAATVAALDGNSKVVALEVTIAGVEPWSPDAPNLYRMTAALLKHGRPVDEIEEIFGFRTIETREGRFFLNGEPLYLRAALDQDYYPDTICTVPSVAFIEDQFRKAKELGLNCLRCHIKAADPRYYEVADRMGLLIWTELPNGGLSTMRSRRRKEATLKGIVDRDCNHPSIIIWTIINENWGVDLVHDSEHREWLKRIYHWLKAYDPMRLVVDNSPLAPSFHVETDIADYHYYAAFPDSRREWNRFVDQLASRASWLYSPEGDAVATGKEPLMCSEFGNWGLPHPDDLRDAEGREPWWFETGHDWGEGVMYAHGVENRFSDWSLDRVFGSLGAFVEAAQWQQFSALKYEIETMRRKPSLSGYVITEFTDVHWESNGLLDMRRNTRAFHHVFRTVNADTVVVPHWDRLSYWAGETIRIDVAVAHGAGPSLQNATVEAFLGEARLIAVPPLHAGGVVDLGTLTFQAPAVDASRLQRLTFELRSADGEILASNYLNLAVHPQRQVKDLRSGPLWSPDRDVQARLVALGYSLAGRLEDASLVIARMHDAEIAAYVRGGGSLLLLPEEEGALNPFFPHWQAVKVRSRDGTLWRGDWASSFAWLRRKGAFRDLPGGPLLDETFDRVIPSHVITGCNLLDFQARVHAGLVVGWIHKPVALAVERTYGNGRFLASTFRLFRDPPGADPTATVLLDRLMSLAAGSDQRLDADERSASEPVLM